MEIGFSLGSNEGDVVAHMREAKRHLLMQPGVTFLAQSPLYETEPVDVAPEYVHLRFMNAVLVVESEAGAGEWLARLHDIEHAMGRRRGADRNAPRPIDIDILYAGAACIDSGGLEVPHPRWAKRRFVVQPLADVRPDLVLPGTNRTVSAILADLIGGEVTATDIPW
jgi:2-amino-4-hydroxy-6-hydroxymethyldihydropteridine diphosphokinase